MHLGAAWNATALIRPLALVAGGLAAPIATGTATALVKNRFVLPYPEPWKGLCCLSVLKGIGVQLHEKARC